MKSTLMSPKELNERYTPELALELSIEKHKRARLKENWEQLCVSFYSFFYGDACGLCIRHNDSEGCNQCPIRPEGSGCSSHWFRALEAIESRDREKFLKHSSALIKQMEAAR